MKGKKTKAKRELPERLPSLGADAVLYCRQKWAGDEWMRDVSETDDSQRDVWRLLADPGVAA